MSSEAAARARRGPFGRVRAIISANERAVALSYIAIVGLVGAMVLLPPFRGVVFGAAEAGFTWWDSRWDGRIARAERLAALGDHAGATALLEAIDRQHPATDIRHRRNLERIRLLRLLGASYLAQDRKRLTLETYERLVAFAPRDFMDHYLLATAAAHFAEDDLALTHYEQALAIHPSHLPSVRAVVAHYLAGSDFAPVLPVYQRYLDAQLYRRIVVQLADTAELPVAVDARVRDLDLPVSAPAGWSGALRIETGGFPVEVERVTLVPASHVGAPRAAPVALADDGADWRATGLTRVAPGRYRSTDTLTVLEIPIPEQASGIDRVQLRLRLFKPTDEELWTMFEKSCRNLLHYDVLEQARQRTMTVTPAALADSIRAYEP